MSVNFPDFLKSWNFTEYSATFHGLYCNLTDYCIPHDVHLITVLHMHKCFGIMTDD